MQTALVTGASTGIGRASARALSTTHHVWAGVRNDADAASVLADGLTPITLDITRPANVAAAVETIAAFGDGTLDVLVNNAGIAVPMPLESISDEDFAHQFEVNVFGLHRVTRELLPAIIAARGRVVMVGSIAGRVGFPIMGAYASSKHAVEGYSDVLRREVAHLGVRVAVIEPGMVATPIWEKSISGDDVVDALPERYRDLARKVRDRASNGPTTGIAPEEVAAAIVHAATSDRPRGRYALPTQERVIARLLPLLPETLSDALLRRELS